MKLEEINNLQLQKIEIKGKPPQDGLVLRGFFYGVRGVTRVILDAAVKYPMEQSAVDSRKA